MDLNRNKHNGKYFQRLMIQKIPANLNYKSLPAFVRNFETVSVKGGITSLMFRRGNA